MYGISHGLLFQYIKEIQREQAGNFCNREYWVCQETGYDAKLKGKAFIFKQGEKQ
jgi:hypothetical protein